MSGSITLAEVAERHSQQRGKRVMPEDPQIRARITTALRGLEAAKVLAGGDLLVQARNAELLDIENWVALILRRVQTEIDNRGLD
jgi:hypothetical protein